MESKVKTYKKKSIKTLDKIYCDVCGSLTTDDYGNHENATIEAIWGYHSNQDGTMHEIHMFVGRKPILLSSKVGSASEPTL